MPQLTTANSGFPLFYNCELKFNLIKGEGGHDRYKKTIKIQTRKAVTEEGGAELLAATDLCGVQVVWEFKPSWKPGSSKASRAFLGG